MDASKDKLFRFVPYGSSGRQRKSIEPAQKRWIEAPCVRACQKCRKRKKRCTHGTESLDDGRHGRDWGCSQLSGMDTESSACQATREASAQPDDEARFVGDLNPEAAFLAATSPVRSSRSNGDAEDIGVWTARKRRKMSPDVSQPSTSGHGARPQPVENHSGHHIQRSPWLPSLLIPNFEDTYTRLLPPSQDMNRLYKIYLDDIHPIFPAIDIKAFEQKTHLGTCDYVFLQQAICLAASKNPSASPFLRLPTMSNISTHADFGRELIFAIQTAVNLGLVRNKLVLTQGLALAGFLTQFTQNRDGSLQLTANAVIHCQTAGMHLKKEEDQPDRAFSNQLFCCVWALDRLNAAFHGRALLMHERDFGINLHTCLADQQPCFQVFLRSIKLLDEVIELYRPKVDTGPLILADNFPLFESHIEVSQALNVKSRLLALATVELLYHSVAMLSCRTGPFGKQPESDHPSNAYLRQHLSASRATAIVSSEFSNQLPYIPLLPYAISLSLRVAYRDLRTAKAPMLRRRAREQLLLNASMLRKLGEVFDSASTLAQLAEKTVHEMDKVFSSKLGKRGPSSIMLEDTTNGPNKEHGHIEGDNRKLATRRHTRAQEQLERSLSRRSSTHNAPRAIQTRSNDPNPESMDPDRNHVNSERPVPPGQLLSVDENAQISTTSQSHGSARENTLTPRQLECSTTNISTPPIWTLESPVPSALLDLDMVGGDFDVFAHFDPDFNLDAVDATLGEDMMMPWFGEDRSI